MPLFRSKLRLDSAEHLFFKVLAFIAIYFGFLDFLSLKKGSSRWRIAGNFSKYLANKGLEMPIIKLSTCPFLTASLYSSTSSFYTVTQGLKSAWVVKGEIRLRRVRIACEHSYGFQPTINSGVSVMRISHKFHS